VCQHLATVEAHLAGGLARRCRSISLNRSSGCYDPRFPAFSAVVRVLLLNGNGGQDKPAKWGVPVDFHAPEVYIYLLRILQAESPSPTMAFEVANPRRNRIDAVGVSVDIIIGEVRP